MRKDEIEDIENMDEDTFFFFFKKTSNTIEITEEDKFKYRLRFPKEKTDPSKKEAMREARLKAQEEENVRKDKYTDVVSKKLQELRESKKEQDDQEER